MNEEKRTSTAWFLQKRVVRDLSLQIRESVEIRAREEDLARQFRSTAKAAEENRKCIAGVETALLSTASTGCRLAWGFARLEQLRRQAQELNTQMAELQIRMDAMRRDALHVQKRMQMLHTRNEMLQEKLEEQAIRARICRAEQNLEEDLEALDARDRTES